MPSGWRLVAVVSLALIAVNASLIGWLGWGEAFVRAVVRSSARSSVLLFLLSFSAYGLRRVWPSIGTEWLVRNRPFVSVSLVVSHGIHLAGLILLGVYFPDPFLIDLDAFTIVGGGSAYALIGAMALVSFDRPAARIGARGARVIDAVASYYVWLVFFNSFVGRALEESIYGGYGAVVAALALALPLRLLAQQSAPALGLTLNESVDR